MNLFSRRRRPPHLGKYPMEKIRRVDKTTTLIIEDEVKRVPRRADGFIRADHGDFGEQQKQARIRTGSSTTKGAKVPLNGAFGDNIRSFIPLQDGDIAVEKAPIPDDPELIANNMKSLAYFLDADVVGICEAKDYCWYSHDRDGNKIKARHQYAIVILIDQGFYTNDASTGDDWISGSQSYRAYLRGAEIGNIIAAYIRNLGYEARNHTAMDSEVLHLPLILLAGLGELSRIGEVVINPFIGPRFKSVVVTTNIPLKTDKPIDFGLQDFCSKCQKCARECPVGAIPYGDKIMYNGYETWKPDVPNCTSYRVSNPKGAGCGRCMKTCPWNNEGILAYRMVTWIAIKIPFMRKFLAWLDDFVGNGNQNETHRWWFDLDNDNGKIVIPKATNEKGIHPDKKQPKNHRISYYTVDSLPKFDEKGAWPFDRKGGWALKDTLETPEEARKRTEKTNNKPS
jgi:reductive dehalogenase